MITVNNSVSIAEAMETRPEKIDKTSLVTGKVTHIWFFKPWKGTLLAIAFKIENNATWFKQCTPTNATESIPWANVKVLEETEERFNANKKQTKAPNGALCIFSNYNISQVNSGMGKTWQLLTSPYDLGGRRNE